MKNFLAIIVCSGLLLFLAGCSFDFSFGDDTDSNGADVTDSADSADGVEQQANWYEGNGFSVHYPEDWIYEEPEENIVIFSGQEGSEAYDATVNIQTMQWGLAYDTFNDFYEDFKAQITGAGGRISDLGREDFIQDEVKFDSAGFNAEYTSNGTVFQQLVIALDRGDGFFHQINYTAPQNIFNKYEDEAFYILDSIKLAVEHDTAEQTAAAQARQSKVEQESGLVDVELAELVERFSFQDNFHQLKEDFWFAGEWVTMEEVAHKISFSDGVAELRVEETDRGPFLLSRPLEMEGGEVIQIKRRALVEYGNEYLNAGMSILETSKKDMVPLADEESWRRNMGSSLVSVSYLNYHHEPDQKAAKEGFAVKGVDWRDNNQYHVLDPIFGEWFEEELIYHTGTGEVVYRLNGEEVSLQTELVKEPYIRVFLHPYGWYTGHKLLLDHFSISVKE